MDDKTKEDKAFDTISPGDVNAMEKKRIKMLDDAGINEDEVIAKARQDHFEGSTYFSQNNIQGKDDLRFCMQDQWSSQERQELKLYGKPAFVFNKIYPITKKIAGEERKNKPNLLVRSLTGKASQEQIDLRTDLVRTISYQSQNDLVYQTAFMSALRMGFGAFQICVDYENPHSFNRRIYYDLIQDATLTVFDPRATMPHKGDGDWYDRIYLMGTEEFKATYPYITNPVSFQDQAYLNGIPETRDKVICLCDRFVKEWFPIMIHKLSNDQVVTDDEWKDMQKNLKLQDSVTEGMIVNKIVTRDMPRIVMTRQSQDYKIKHYRLLQNQIVDFSDWPSKYLPGVFVDGDSYFLDGKQFTKSFVRDMRDAQRFLNYVGCEIGAEIKNRRREQWLVTPDNIIGREKVWSNPELQQGALIAKPDPKTGQMPMKQQPWELSQTLIQNFQRAGQDIREIAGFSEAEQESSRDISGVAKRERRIEGSMSSYVYQDNFHQAIEQGGRIVLDLLPFVYGGNERNVVLAKQDMQTRSIVLNQNDGNGNIKNTLDGSDYDIEIDVGPSFAVQREVSLEFLQQTLQASPQTFPLIADIWAGNLDVEQRQKLVDRFKTMVPPEILAKEEGKPAPPPKPNPQEMMMQQEMQMKQEQIQESQAMIKIKAQELQLKQQRLELDKAEIMIQAQKDQQEMQMNIMDHRLDVAKSVAVHGLDHKKTNLDFNAKITNILSDIYKHNTLLDKENNEKD